MGQVIRTDNYKRKNWKPLHLLGARSDSNVRSQNLMASASKMKEDDLLKNMPAWVTGIPNTDDIKEFFTKDKEKARKYAALMEEYPNLDRVLDELVEARLSLLNSDEPWSQDKDYGWGIRDLSSPILDEEFQQYIGNVRYEEGEDGSYRLFYDELDKFPTDPLERAILEKRIGDNIYEQLTAPMLYPMTKEQAESKGYGWVPSTDEYINGLYETDPVMVDYADRELLYGDLKRRLEHKLFNDTDRKYGRARERYSSNPNQFELHNPVGKLALEAVAPFSAGALYDDELNFKTSPAERIIRGTGDVGLGVASFALPFGLARAGLTKAGGKVVSKFPRFANKYSMIKSPLHLPKIPNKYGSRRLFSEVPQIFGGVTDGVIGGLADYGLERGFDQGLTTIYGDGAQSIHQPITAVDLATYGLLGGLLGGSRKYGTGRAYDDMKAKMNKGDPSKISKKEIDDYLKLSDEGVDRKEVMNKWAWKAFDDYELKYPNSARQVEKPPKPEIYAVDVDDTQKLPLLQQSKGELKEKGTNIEDNILYKEVEKGENDVVEDGKRIMMGILGEEVDDVADKIPLGFVEPTDKFVKDYVNQNLEYFDGMMKNHALAGDGDFYIDNIGLADALKLYQNRQNLESGLFDGGKVILNDKQFKQQKNIASGGSNKGKSSVFGQNQQGKDEFYSMILNKKSKLGTSDDGVNFKPATEQQLKDYERANAKRRERAGMSDFTRDDFEKARKKYSNKYIKVMSLPFGVAHGIYNVHPFSRTIGDVAPYQYISPINTEKEDK